MISRLLKKTVFGLIIGFLLSFLFTIVYAGYSVGSTYNWSHGSTDFYNFSTILTDRNEIRAFGLIGSSITEPTGYLGTKNCIVNSSGVIAASSSWRYSTGQASFFGTGFDRSTLSNGNYYSQTETRYFRNGNFITQWTYGSSSQPFPD